MALVDQIAALATAVGQQIKALRTSKADDVSVVHISGTETVSGIKTFGSAPIIPIGTGLSNPVRRDDARLSDSRTPTAHASTHASGGGDAVTPAAIGAEQTAAKSTAAQKVANGYIGADANGNVAPAHLYVAGASAYGVITLAGDLGGTAAAPTVPGLATKVPLTQRGPIGGIATPTYTATATPDATTGNHIRYVATGNLTVNVPTGGVDGQRILFEVQASGAQRTVTFASGYEVSGPVPGQVFTVASGAWGYFAVVNRGGTWRLLSADPIGVATSQAIAYAATITPDASAGSQFHVTATGNVTVAAPANPNDGQRLMVEVFASGAARTAGISGTTTNASGAALPLSIGSGKVGHLGFVYSARAGHWVLVAATTEP